MSMTFGYTQWLWMSLKNTDISIGALNDAIAAQQSILFAFNFEMLRKLQIEYVLAVTIWYVEYILREYR